MDMVGINLKKMVLIIKANGKTTKCKAKANLSSAKTSYNTRANGNPTNTTAGEHNTPTRSQPSPGYLTKDNLKMVSNKVEDK